MEKITYKHINLLSLKENTGGIIDIEIELLQLFSDIIDEFITSLEKELPKRNWQKLYDATHKIKPNVSMFGISSMESIIDELENNFRLEENLENIDNTVKTIVYKFKEIKKEIEWELSSMTNS
jgi:HPt (histidine-containing phosphotransfer) domain-containing protein